MVEGHKLSDARQFTHRTGATEVPEQGKTKANTEGDNEAIGQDSAFQRIMSDMMSDFNSTIGKNSAGLRLFSLL